MNKRQVFLFFSSLKLAVTCILSLAAVLGIGTVLESLYGMRGAHLLVYGTWWFGGLLFLLGTNVFCAALSRYPWKRHQIGFVVTHAGILVLLFGSFLTQRFGVDGNLPIEEKTRGGSVLLTDLRLMVTDEETGERLAFPVPETGRASDGDLMRVALFDKYSINVDKFLPRAVLKNKRTEPPVPGLGTPSVDVELTSSRFKVNETLESRKAQGPTEFSLGPAVLSFQKLWNANEEKDFLESTEEKKSSENDKGMLTIVSDGREYRISLPDLLSGWQPLGDSGNSIRATKYYTHAVVEGNELVNKSPEPINPALSLEIKSAEGSVELHTLFANFPQFPTLHRRSAPAKVINPTFQLALAGKPEREEMGIVGKQRGQLRIAQSADDKKLFYKVFSREGKLNAKGELTVGEAIPTGWMDAKLKVTHWEPASVASSEPHYIDKVSGNDSLLSAVHFYIDKGDRTPASEKEADWLVLGETRRVVVNNRRLLLELGKETLELPFKLELQKFKVGRDPGTNKAASYESTVVPLDGDKPLPAVLISMNEPLHFKGYTFYQASYQERPGKPPISVFSVNRDPGRWVKYAGSILITLGIAIMFYMNPHYLGIILGKKRS